MSETNDASRPNSETPPRPLLTVNESAARLRVDRRTLYRLIAAGKIRVLRLSRRATRVEPEEIDAYLARLREESRDGEEVA
ncbi:MAG TPA: helix-turn-helix domain-containing protein [Micromonosporaceae bacterium]